MIEKMLKTTVICRMEDRDLSLDALRSLGILHVEQTNKPDSSSVSALSLELDKINQVTGMLTDYKPIEKRSYKHLSGKKITEKAIELFEQNSELKKELESFLRNKTKLLPWGNFSFSSIEKAKENGLYIYLCVLPKNEIDNFKDKGSIEIINNIKNRVYFALLSQKEYAKDSLPLAPLPVENISLAEIETKIREITKKHETNNASLSAIASEVTKISEYTLGLEEELELLSLRSLRSVFQ